MGAAMGAATGGGGNGPRDAVGRVSTVGAREAGGSPGAGNGRDGGGAPAAGSGGGGAPAAGTGGGGALCSSERDASSCPRSKICVASSSSSQSMSTAPPFAP